MPAYRLFGLSSYLLSAFVCAVLKGESISVIGCGKSHTLVGTSTGQLFSFGDNNDRQCALEDEGSVETPTEVQLKRPITFTQLAGGSCHSVGLDGRCGSSPPN